jgi:hypothetical protein
LDLYCIECEQDSVFQTPFDPNTLVNALPTPNISPTSRVNYSQEITESVRRSVIIMRDRIFVVILHCSRKSDHSAYFIFRLSNQKLTKIGQYPSIADLHFPDIKKYRKILGDRYSEFSKGVGLISHGVGIGAFVYLRRIFEHLIEEAHSASMSDPDWDNNTFLKGRMDEKILLLQDRLPPFLVENRTLYSILSIGVHSLTEEQCLAHFNLVKVAIEMILDEKITEQQRIAKRNEASKAISDAHTKLK